MLITGPKDSGKTSTIRNLFEYYKKNGWIVKEFNKRAGKDFNGVLVNAEDDREIIFHSDTDLFICIDHMVEYIEKHPKANIIITSCRNKPDPMRNVLFAKLNLKSNENQYQEIGLGRMPRGGSRSTAVAWYLDVTQKNAVSIASLGPFLL